MASVARALHFADIARRKPCQERGLGTNLDPARSAGRQHRIVVEIAIVGARNIRLAALRGHTLRTGLNRHISTPADLPQQKNRRLRQQIRHQRHPSRTRQKIPLFNRKPARTA